jgi:hypothetical protein
LLDYDIYEDSQRLSQNEHRVVLSALTSMQTRRRVHEILMRMHS